MFFGVFIWHERERKKKRVAKVNQEPCKTKKKRLSCARGKKVLFSYAQYDVILAFSSFLFVTRKHIVLPNIHHFI